MSSRSQNFLVIISVIKYSHCKAAKYTLFSIFGGGTGGAGRKQKKRERNTFTCIANSLSRMLNSILNKKVLIPNLLELLWWRLIPSSNLGLSSTRTSPFHSLLLFSPVHVGLLNLMVGAVITCPLNSYPLFLWAHKLLETYYLDCSWNQIEYEFR